MIPPFENLAASPDFDWMGHGFSEALRLQLAGIPGRRPLAVAALRDAPATGPGRIVHGYFCVEGGRLRVHADVEDTATRRMVQRVAVAGPLAGGMLPLARAVAHRIDANARELPAGNADAFRAYISALRAPDPGAADREFDRAVTADPGFGAAYLAWTQVLASRGDRERAVQVLAAARGHSARFSGLERDRLELIAATMSGDRAGRRQALIALTRSDPTDPAVYRMLAGLETTGHAYAAAAKWYTQALALEPGDAVLLNQLGYAHAWAGDLRSATAALSRYRDLRPDDANPLDSLGDVQYYAGRFAEAEKYYKDAYAKDPSFQGGGALYKAAWARLMQGDLRGADEIFGRFVQRREAAHDAAVPVRVAQWEYLTGRRRQAIPRLEEYARTAPPAAASLALSQLALWSLEATDRRGAREYALKAPVQSPLTAVCEFITEPPAPDPEWAARAARVFSQPGQDGMRQLALAYALLLSKRFEAAIAPLEQLYAATAPASPDWPAMPLAWALVETERFERVPELLRLAPLPTAAGEQPFLSAEFPRLLYLRGMLAEKQHRREEARANYQLFLRFVGPDSFGEQYRATRGLERATGELERR